MDLRFTYDSFGAQFSVPYTIVRKYLSSCSEQQLKVLLCILSGDRATSSAELSALSGYSEADVAAAVDYWAGLGVIGIEGAEPTPAPNKAEPVSQVEAVKPTRTSTGNRSYTYSPIEIKEKTENDGNVKKLLSEIQVILGVTLNSHESSDLIELYEYYKFDVPSILMGAQYCRASGKKSIAYLRTVMVRWYEEGIHSYGEIEQELIRRNDEHRYLKLVMKTFGMESKPSKTQCAMIENWRSMGVAIELVEIAYDKCLDAKNKLIFSYIDQIIKSWAQGGISTPEQVREDDKRYHDKKSSQSKEGSSYDLDEVEEFAMSFTIKDSSGEE